MHVVAERRLGLPQDARSAFDLLHGDGIIDADLARRLKAMVGFRNIAIHDDQQVHMGTLGHILNERLGDVRDHIARVLDG